MADGVYPGFILLSRPLFWIEAVVRLRAVRRAGWVHAVHELYGLLYSGRILFVWECKSNERGLDYSRPSTLDFWRDFTASDLVKFAARYFVNSDDGPPIPVAAGVEGYLFIEDGQITAYINGTLPMTLPPPVKAEPFRGSTLPAADSGKVVIQMLHRVVVSRPLTEEAKSGQHIESAPPTQPALAESKAEQPSGQRPHARRLDPVCAMLERYMRTHKPPYPIMTMPERELEVAMNAVYQTMPRQSDWPEKPPSTTTFMEYIKRRKPRRRRG